jgi:hypothetical protein
MDTFQNYLKRLHNNEANYLNCFNNSMKFAKHKYLKLIKYWYNLYPQSQTLAMDIWWELFSKLFQITGWFGLMVRMSCGVFPVELLAHIMSFCDFPLINNSTKKLWNFYLGLGYEFGLQRIRHLTIMRLLSMVPNNFSETLH